MSNSLRAYSRAHQQQRFPQHVEPVVQDERLNFTSFIFGFTDAWDAISCKLKINNMLQMRVVNRNYKDFVEKSYFWSFTWNFIANSNSNPKKSESKLNPPVEFENMTHFVKVKKICKLFTKSIFIFDSENTEGLQKYKAFKEKVVLEGKTTEGIKFACQDYLLTQVPHRIAIELSYFTRHLTVDGQVSRSFNQGFAIMKENHCWMPNIPNCDKITSLKNYQYYHQSYTKCFDFKYFSADINALVNLKVLDLRDCNIKYVGSLQGLDNLEEITFISTHLKELKVGHLPKLVKLNVQVSDLKQISFYDNVFPNLTYLNLDKNPKFKTILGISTLKNLKQISLEEVSKFSQSDLYNCPNLQYIYVDKFLTGFLEHYDQIKIANGDSPMILQGRGICHIHIPTITSVKKKIGVKQERSLEKSIKQSFSLNCDALGGAAEFYRGISDLKGRAKPKKSEPTQGRVLKRKAKSQDGNAEAKRVRVETPATPPAIQQTIAPPTPAPAVSVASIQNMIAYIATLQSGSQSVPSLNFSPAVPLSNDQHENYFSTQLLTPPTQFEEPMNFTLKMHYGFDELDQNGFDEVLQNFGDFQTPAENVVPDQDVTFSQDQGVHLAAEEMEIKPKQDVSFEQEGAGEQEEKPEAGNHSGQLSKFWAYEMD